MKEKSLKIIIIILVIIILSLGSYIFFDKVINKDNDIQENNNKYSNEDNDHDIEDSNENHDKNLIVDGIDYQEFFEEAEELYAKFTGYYEPDLDSSNSIKEGDITYYLVTDSIFKNMNTLENELNRYFSNEIVKNLLNKKVDNKYPLYKEINDRLYRFGGFVGQYGYNMGESNLNIVNKADDKFTIHNKIVFNFDDNAMETSGFYEYDYNLEKDLNGIFKFTNFELPASFYNYIIN